MHVRSFVVAALTAGLAVACEDEPTRPPPTRFATTASAATATVTQDDTVRFSVTVRNETSGQAIEPPTGSYAQSLDPSIATVAATSTPGVFRILARRPGTARIIAGFAGATVGAQDTVVVTVAARPVASVTVTPETGQTWADSTFEFTPTLLDAAGDTITRRTARFRLLDHLRFIVDSLGDTVRVDTLATVSAGDTVNATADGGLNEVAGGVVTARPPDTVPVFTVRVIAEREGKADTSTLTIVRRPVATVTVTPNPASVAVNDTIQLTATLRAANGTVVTGRTVTWSSSDTTLATVSQTGKVAGKAPTATGTAVIITATSEGKSGTADVHVTPP